MDEPVIARTVWGEVEGHRGADGLEFHGVPFATAGRFAPPGPPAGWTGVRDAHRPGPAAPQPDRAVAVFTHGPRPHTSETGCLNLNVFTPALEGARPVLVWLHGGGFAIGHGAAGLYHGGRLSADADIVVVTVNYRLGSLGWLAHPDLAPAHGGPAGNWGLLDQIAALRWVAENISAWGGDPAQVTVAGQSAGALCAIDLLVAPEATGLFARALLQSPPLADVAQPMPRAVAWAEALSAAVGGRGSFDPERLRAQPADELVAAHEALLELPEFRGTRGGALPTVDPPALPRSPREVPGAAPSVDVLIGATAEEGTFFFGSPWRPAPPPDRIPGIVAHLTGEEPGKVIERHRRRWANGSGLAPSLEQILAGIATEAMVAGPLADWAGARARAGGRVWRFRVDHPGAGDGLGATHTVEVPLLFGTWRDGSAGQRLGGQAPGAEPVAEQLVRAWARFVRGDSPGWNPLGAETGAGEVGVFGGIEPFRAEALPLAPAGRA